MGTSFGFLVGRRKMRFFGSFVLLVAFAVVVVSVLSVEGAEPGWGLRTDYEFDNCTGAGPGVERYLKNNTCIPTGSSSSNLYRFLGTGVEIVGCVDSNCSTCNPALPVLYNACFQGAIYTAGVAETALNETIQRTAVNYQYATSTTQCNFENAVVIIKLGCYAPGAKGTYQQHQCTQDNVVEYRDCSPSGCSGCSGPFTGLINTCNVLHSNLAMEQTKCAPAASTVSSGVLTSTAGGTGSSSSAATVVPSWLSSFVSVLCVAAAVVGLIV